MVQSHVYRMLDVLGNEGVLRLGHCTTTSLSGVQLDR